MASVFVCIEGRRDSRKEKNSRRAQRSATTLIKMEKMAELNKLMKEKRF
jgi:hypothetical protein